MNEDHAFEINNLFRVDEPVTDVRRQGAPKMPTQNIEAEVEAFPSAHTGLSLADGHRRVVRNGYPTKRGIQTGGGLAAVHMPWVRNKGGVGGGVMVRFASKIRSSDLRRAQSLEALIPRPYWKGVSTAGFGEAMAALLEPDAPGLSAGAISRLKGVWKVEMVSWPGRDLSRKRHACFNPSPETAGRCAEKNRRRMEGAKYPGPLISGVRLVNVTREERKAARLFPNTTKDGTPIKTLRDLGDRFSLAQSLCRTKVRNLRNRSINSRGRLSWSSSTLDQFGPFAEVSLPVIGIQPHDQLTQKEGEEL